MREVTTLTVGVDLGDVRSEYVVVDAGTGEVVDEGKVAMKRPAMRAWLASLPRARVALEAGSQSAWVTHLASDTDLFSRQVLQRIGWFRDGPRPRPARPPAATAKATALPPF